MVATFPVIRVVSLGHEDVVPESHFRRRRVPRLLDSWVHVPVQRRIRDVVHQVVVYLPRGAGYIEIHPGTAVCKGCNVVEDVEPHVDGQERAAIGAVVSSKITQPIVRLPAIAVDMVILEDAIRAAVVRPTTRYTAEETTTHVAVRYRAVEATGHRDTRSSGEPL